MFIIILYASNIFVQQLPIYISYVMIIHEDIVIELHLRYYD